MGKTNGNEQNKKPISFQNVSNAIKSLKVILQNEKVER